MSYYAISQNKKQGYLLLDEAAVQSNENCRLRFCQAVKDPANPIIHATKPWEGDGPYTVMGGVVYLPEEGIYRMPYSTYQAKPYSYGGGYAESRDGLNWEKPALKGLDPEKFEIGWDQRASLNGRHYLPAFPMPGSGCYDPRPACPENERYKILRYRITGMWLNTSPDGMNWTEYPEPVWHACGDNFCYFWDPHKEKFVIYFKLWKIWAEEKDDSPTGSHPITALCTTWNTKDLGDGWVELYGDHFVTLHPESKAEVGYQKYIVRGGSIASDDGGGGHLSGAWYSKRVIHWAESEDFVHWEHEQEVLNVDERDRPDSNIQYAQVFMQGGYYLAMLSMHDQRGHFDQQLAFSSDGIHWKRPWRGNLIPHGTPGSFDHGEVSPPVTPIVTETQLIIYYGGMKRGHAEKGTRDQAIGRAMLRRDGFACWQAWEETAMLQTVAFPVQRDNLFLNVDAEGGWVTVALLDENGNIIPGYEHENCKIIAEDSLTYPDCFIPVKWEGQQSLPKGNVCVQLRFQNAAVYSVLI